MNKDTHSHDNNHSGSKPPPPAFPDNADFHNNPETLRNEELEQQITSLAGHLNAATYRLLVFIAEYDRNQGWGAWGCCSCAHWLNWRCGIAIGAAREKVRTARALENLPAISRAFASGQLSFSKARAITRIADSSNEEDLLMIAEYGAASQVEKLVRQYRRVLRIEELEKERGAARQYHRNRAVNYYWDDDGYLVVNGRLTPEQGALFIKAMEAAETALEDDNQHVPAGTPPPEEDADESITPCRTRFENKRADAVTLLAESFLHSGAQSGTQTTKTADRYQVVVHVDEATLCHTTHPPDYSHPPGQRCELQDGPALSAQTARRLCCDSSLIYMHEEGIGRKSRSIPPAMRRALQERDKGCRFPGCTASRFIDGHHIKHWADGGETKLDNLVLLCRHHHRKVHEDGFDVQMNATGDLSFYTPEGEDIPRAMQLPAPDRELEALNRQLGLEIDSNTVFSWNGDTMDYGMAIDGLEQHRWH